MLSLDLVSHDDDDHYDGIDDHDDDKHGDIPRTFGMRDDDHDGIVSSPVGPRNVQTIFSVIWQGTNMFRFVTK